MEDKIEKLNVNNESPVNITIATPKKQLFQSTPPSAQRAITQENQKWEENYHNIELVLQSNKHEIAMLNAELQSYKKRNNLLQKQVNTLRLQKKNSKYNNNRDNINPQNLNESPNNSNKSNHLYIIKNQRLRNENTQFINEIEFLKNENYALSVENDKLKQQYVSMFYN